jgi:hypothetical protein
MEAARSQKLGPAVTDVFIRNAGIQKGKQQRREGAELREMAARSGKERKKG